MMDAAARARKFALSPHCRQEDAEDIFALLDALEQAQRERDEERARWKTRYQAQSDAAFEAIAQRDQARKDAKDARALLGEAKPWLVIVNANGALDLLARIEAVLEQKL